jgi:ABC-type glycerol-3-phosphate transport system permease component
VLSIAIMNVWRGSSIIAIFLLAGFNAIPDELLDYGKLETRSRWLYFWRVVLPLNRRIAVLALMVAVTITYLDFVSMYAESDMQRVRQFYLGDKLPYENFDAYWNQSPIKYIRNAKTPTSVGKKPGPGRAVVPYGSASAAVR